VPGREKRSVISAGTLQSGHDMRVSNVLISFGAAGPERGVKRQQLTQRLSARRVVRNYATALGERKLGTNSPDIHWDGVHRFAPYCARLQPCVAGAGRFGGVGFVNLHRGGPLSSAERRLVVDPVSRRVVPPLAADDRHDRVCKPAGQAALGTPSPSFAARALGNRRPRNFRQPLACRRQASC
jgi:hypothetical protein